MSLLEVWQRSVIESWNQVVMLFGGLMPSLLGAIATLVIGIILAYWVKRLVLDVFEIIKLESFSKNLGIEGFLRKSEINTNLSTILATLVEWFIILIFFLAFADILGLDSVSSVLTSILGYVPNIISGVFIFAAGYLLANVVEKAVVGALKTVDHEIALPLGKFSRLLIIFTAALAALGELKIAESFANIFFQGLIYTVVIAVGLSLGLGSKDTVAKIIDSWYQSAKRSSHKNKTA